MKTERIIIAILTLILISVMFAKCKNEKLFRTQINTHIMDKETLKQQVLNKDEDLKAISKEFLKIQSVQTVKIKTTIPRIVEIFKEPITIKEIDTITKELKFERKGAIFDKWFEFGYVLNQDSLSIEPFSTWTEIKRVDGFKRKWVLGKQTYESKIMFTNPYINIEEVNTYKVEIPVKWYETRASTFGVGAILGAILIK